MSPSPGQAALVPSLGALYHEIRHLPEDLKAIRSLRIGQLHTLFFSYILNAALALPDRAIRDTHLFLLTPYWIYLLLIADLLLEEHGHCFSLDEMDERLAAAVRRGECFQLESSDFIARGASAAQLAQLARRRDFPVTGDPWRLIGAAVERITAIIDQQPRATTASGARQEFVRAYNIYAASALLERRLVEQYGPCPPVECVWSYLQLKSKDAMDPWLNCLLLASGNDPQRYDTIKTGIGAYIYYFAGVDDDVRDVAIDYRRQPNIVLSIASQHFPREYASLIHQINHGETFRGWGGGQRLRRVVPDTMAYLEGTRAASARQLRRDPFFRAVLLAHRTLILTKQFRESIRALFGTTQDRKVSRLVHPSSGG